MSNVEQRDVVVVGAGLSGIAMAVAAREEGSDVLVLERAEQLGGVWRDNSYPGAACDIPSYLYSYSYAQRRDWSRPCSPQAEILGYLHDVVASAGLEGAIRCGVRVVSAAWDEPSARWRVACEDGGELECRALVLACGQLSEPAYPAVPGVGSFAGPAFHSARWDHGVALEGKRVAVIGTGASAVQFVPEVAERAAHVDVFQRTPPWVLPRRNRPYAPWARRLIGLVPGLQRLRREFMVAFCEMGILGQTRLPAVRWGLRAWSTWHLRRQVRDPALRRRLTPDYPIGCKRVLFTSKYLPALARPHVDLVDEPVAEVVPEGVRTASGEVREADVLVYGTGFQAHAFVAPMEVAGRDGRSLAEAWEGGAEAHLGVEVAGFPNLFLLYGPNTNLGFGSIIVMVEAQVGYVVAALRALRGTGADALDVLPEVQRASGSEVQERLRRTVWTSCRSWYREDDDGRIVNNWPGQMAEYRAALREVKLEDHELVRAGG